MMITADQARQNAQQFDLTAEEILAKVEKSIDANSSAGARSILISFKKEAASDDEIAEVLRKLAEGGFESTVHEVQPKSDETMIRVEW